MNNFTKNIFSYKLLIILGIFLVSPSFSFAQSVENQDQDILDQINQVLLESASKIPTTNEVMSNALNDYLEVTSVPKYPGPYENVSITVQSYLTNLKKARTSWYVNGVLEESGTGVSQFNFSVGGAGSASVIDIVIRTEEGSRIDKRIIFRPSGIELLWEAKTHVPPFYKGRALASPESAVRIVAMTDFVSSGKQMRPNDLFFVWTEGGRINEPASGFGKNVYYANASKPFGSLDVEVEVSSRGGSFTASKNIKINTVKPKIVFYRNSPLEGVVYGNALLSSLYLSHGDEIEVIAEPYFMSENGSMYGWYMNNRKLEEKSRTIVLRNETGDGMSRLKAVAQNTEKTFQITDAVININLIDSQSAFLGQYR